LYKENKHQKKVPIASSSPIQTVTVGSGITPDQPLRASIAGHGLRVMYTLLPSVGNCTLPRKWNRYFIIYLL